LILVALRLRDSFATALAVTGAVIVAAAFTFVGHTTTHPMRWLLIVLLLAHLLVVAFWFGALLPLYQISTRESPAVAGRVVADFSARAVWLVPGIFVAGLILAVMLLPDLAALFTTYGALLIAKVIGFAVLMLLAMLNKWRYGPALERGDAAAGRAFRRSLIAEYVLIAATLCVTAVLTTFYSPEG
jgi:putative copper export protein